MNKGILYNHRFQWMVLIIIALVAFFYNLGLRVFIEDEGIRNLVALEMMLSGNYIMPTLNDTAYFSKPPLYNWILILFFKLTGVMNEWTARIPTVLFLFSFCWVIYHFVSKYVDRYTGVLAALTFLTCGRILFWDSLLSFIDIFYSMVTYGMLMLLYDRAKKQKWWTLYILSYLLFAIGYMLKGYPSIAFLGVGLLSVMIVFGDWKRLFHPAHFIAALMAAGLIGAYFYLYDSYKPAGDTFMPLLEQSTRRTFLKHDFIEVIQHLITYPFENIYHFLPWTVLVVFCLRKDVMDVVRKHSFIYFNTLAFLLNITVYWLSPEVYPRYILMLMPILFTVFLFLKDNTDKNLWPHKVWNGISNLIIFIVPVGLLFMSIKYHYVFTGVAWAIMIATILFSLLNIFVLLQHSIDRMFLLVLACLLLRIGFDLVALPERHERDTAVDYKAQAIALGEKYKELPISLYKNSKVDYTSSYYFSRTRAKITTRSKESFSKDAFYIYDTSRYDQVVFEYEKIDSFQVREGDRMLYVIKSLE